jgi:hypothetical protein
LVLDARFDPPKIREGKGKQKVLGAQDFNPPKIRKGEAK